MENENDKTAKENTNEQPKPTDDVQMDIETVVPSAHKAEVTPGKDKTPVDDNEEQPADEPTEEEGKKVTEGEEGAEKPATDADQSGTDEESSPEKQAPKQDDETGESAKTEDEDTRSNDDHNGIETVTP